MNVLSLFDGLGGARIALDQLNISCKYFASEIDKYAIQISRKNYLDIKYLGDINYYDNWELPKIDLLIGGSPCQGFSVAGKQLNFDDSRSKLFFKYVKCLEKFKPKYFILENVKMKKEWQNIINKLLKIEPIEINSSLLTAQNRKRLYWTNIKGIEQPKDKGILLKDILEYGIVDRDKSYCITASYDKGTNIEGYIKKGRRQIAFTERRTEEAKRIRTEYRLKYGKDFSPRRSKELVARNDNKMNCLTATFSIKEHTLIDEKLYYRKLTPIECERLQGVPDNYTKGVSNSQRYKMLGNGFTIPVIKHILNYININE